MKRTSLQTVTLPPKNELPAWMQNQPTKELPAWIKTQVSTKEEIAARLAQAHRYIPANAFAPTPWHWSEKLMAVLFALCVGFLFLGTLACFF